MSKEFLWPGLVTGLSLLTYMVLIMMVGRARQKYGVQPPLTSGNPAFERALRVQLNTVEQLVVYLPSLWLFSLTISPLVGAGLGGVWILGRILYAAGYYQAAEKRMVGFAITQLGTVSLLLGAIGGTILQIIKGM